MEKVPKVTDLASGKTPRFIIADITNGKPYVMVVFQTESVAVAELEELLRPYPLEHEWRRRLVVRKADGCGKRGTGGRKCNLAEGHQGAHAEVTWYSSKGRQLSVWFEKGMSNASDDVPDPK